MGKGDKHSQRRVYKKNWVGSKAQREAALAMARQHGKKVV